MFVFSRFLQSHPLAISVILLFQVGGTIALSQVPQQAASSRASLPISVVICTDKGKYSLGDSVTLNASLQNTGDALVYVDRRMFWTGFGGGLKLEICDDQGKSIPARILSDAIMPPPKE